MDTRLSPFVFIIHNVFGHVTSFSNLLLQKNESVDLKDNPDVFPLQALSFGTFVRKHLSAFKTDLGKPDFYYEAYQTSKFAGGRKMQSF